MTLAGSAAPTPVLPEVVVGVKAWSASVSMQGWARARVGSFAAGLPSGGVAHLVFLPVVTAAMEGHCQDPLFY